MKKILSIALVALLAASTVFAGFTGKASVGLGYNFQDESYGMSNSTETKETSKLQQKKLVRMEKVLYSQESRLASK